MSDRKRGTGSRQPGLRGNLRKEPQPLHFGSPETIQAAVVVVIVVIVVVSGARGRGGGGLRGGKMPVVTTTKSQVAVIVVVVPACPSLPEAHMSVVVQLSLAGRVQNLNNASASATLLQKLLQQALFLLLLQLWRRGEE